MEKSNRKRNRVTTNVSLSSNKTTQSPEKRAKKQPESPPNNSDKSLTVENESLANNKEDDCVYLTTTIADKQSILALKEQIKTITADRDDWKKRFKARNDDLLDYIKQEWKRQKARIEEITEKLERAREERDDWKMLYKYRVEQIEITKKIQEMERKYEEDLQ